LALYYLKITPFLFSAEIVDCIMEKTFIVGQCIGKVSKGPGEKAFGATITTEFMAAPYQFPRLLRNKSDPAISRYLIMHSM
jgi:hypothetical protein